MKRTAVRTTILLFIAFVLYGCANVTPTPVTCPSTMLAISVVELLPGYVAGDPVPNAVMTFCPAYEGECVTLLTGPTGHATGRIAPGTWTLKTAVLPQGWLPMQQTDAKGWPMEVYASPGNDSILVYYAYRVAPTRTPAPATVTPTPQIVACPNYAVNCKVTCGANEQEDAYKRCGSGFVCCLPMPTRTATP